jgi:PAS domain S-box-containing protein
VANALQPEIPFICVSGTIGEEKAVELLKKGASDYVIKDRLNRLAFAVGGALKEKEGQAVRKQSEKTLQASKDFLANIINAVGSPVFVKDDKHKFCLVNTAFCLFLNLSAEKLIGKTGYENFPKEQFDVFIAKDKEVIDTGKENINEEFITDGKGQIRTIITKKTLYTDAHGNKFLVGIINDITEQKRAEQEIKQGYIFSETLLKTIPFGMDIVDETGTVLFQSENFSRIFRKDAIGKKCWDLYKDSKEQCFDCPLNKGITIGKTETYESQGVLGNKIFEIIHTGMMYEGKKAMLEIFQDITERKRIEEQQRESNMQFTKLSKNVPGLIYQFSRRVDGTYYVPIASEGIKEIYGCSPEDVLEDFSPIAKVINPDDFDRIVADIEYSAKHLSIFTCEYRVQIEGQPIKWIYTKSIPEKLADGTITWYGFNNDITESKQTELELTIAKDKAEESNRLKSAFLSNMSHEIRTPMNGILGFAALLKKPNLSSESQQDFIQSILISGTRMLNTINSIVDMSKIESGHMNINIDETNINEKLEFIYKFFKPEVESKGLKLLFRNSLTAKESIIKTDKEKAFSILTNLLKNSIKFTSEGSIEFGYEKKGEYLEFFVKDTGIGIPHNQQKFIFERFRQGSESNNRDFEGSGLGLSICKSYVEMLGGRIWVESEEGKGSIFYFTIPYDSVEEETQTIENVVFTENEETQDKKLKILVVEDDEISFSLLTRTLQNISSEVLHAITGVQAIETCRRNPDIDLILMDIRMPEMDGLEATQRIRKFNKDVIIIAQTANAFTGDREKAIGAGCNDYIIKPIDNTLLMALILEHFIN